MKTTKKISFLKVIVLTFVAAGCLISCNQDNKKDGSVAEMQTRLDEIMQDYQQLQQDSENYTQQLAERDSSIQAQAAEIQRLIDQLNAAQNGNGNGNGSVATAQPNTNRAANKANKRLTAQLKAKQQKIDELQASIDQLNRQLDALKATEGFADRSELARLRQIINQQDKQIVALANDKVLLTNDNDSLNARMAYMTSTRNSAAAAAVAADYTTQISTLQNQIAAQQNEITSLREELAAKAALLADAQKAQDAAEKAAADAKANTAKAKGNINKKLAQLQAQCDEYYAEILRLRAENASLKTENDSLRDQVAHFKKSAEDISAQNVKMRDQVNRASVLSTDNIVVTPLKRISGSTGKPTNRASAVSALRIDGMILSNNVIDPGTVTIYAVITSPNNVVLHNGTQQQSFNANGNSSPYTMVQAYEFTGEARAFDMVWSKDSELELEAGIYRVTLYANSHIIGVTEFKLK